MLDYRRTVSVPNITKTFFNLPQRRRTHGTEWSLDDFPHCVDEWNRCNWLALAGVPLDAFKWEAGARSVALCVIRSNDAILALLQIG